MNIIETLESRVHLSGSISGAVLTSTDVIPGVAVYVDANNNGKIDIGEHGGKTNGGGVYTIVGVPAGDATVRQVLPKGVKQITPLNNYGLHVKVISGKTIVRNNFTDTTPPIVIPPITKPQAPTNIKAVTGFVNGVSAVQLSWTPGVIPPGTTISNYVINVSNGAVIEVGSVTSVTLYGGLTSGDSYFFKIATVAKVNNESTYLESVFSGIWVIAA